MTLRRQILSSPEIVSDLASAAEQRFREAEHLLRGGRFVGAVYLFGLACEMWLKLACFRFRGATPVTRVDSQLGPAKAWMAGRAPFISPEKYHSLCFWAEFLILLRTVEGSGMHSLWAGELRHHVVNRLYQDWKIDMRYRSPTISKRQAWRVYNDVAWVRQVWQDLWR